MGWRRTRAILALGRPWLRAGSPPGISAWPAGTHSLVLLADAGHGAAFFRGASALVRHAAAFCSLWAMRPPGEGAPGLFFSPPGLGSAFFRGAFALVRHLAGRSRPAPVPMSGRARSKESPRADDAPPPAFSRAPAGATTSRRGEKLAHASFVFLAAAGLGSAFLRGAFAFERHAAGRPRLRSVAFGPCARRGRARRRW